jgi:hypothetical protein
MALLRRASMPIAELSSEWDSLRFGDDLVVYDDGICSSQIYCYADGRDDNGFPDDTCDVHFTRFELWAL